MAYSNPYLEGNPYLVEKPKNKSGQQALSLALQLYKLKGKGGTTTSQYKIGNTEPGGALEVTDPAIRTEGLDAFDFGKGGEQLGLGEGAEPFAVDASLAPEGAVAAEGSDLSAFTFGEGAEPFIADESLSAFVSAADLEAAAAAGEYGALTEAELAGYAAEEAAMAEAGATAGAEAGGATAGSALGTVGSAASTALPYIALADVGMPIVGKMMEQWTPGEPGGSNVFQKGARITGEEWNRPMEAVHREIFGSEMPQWAQGVFNPGGYLWGKAGCIIISACTSKDSYEVNIARKFRDRYMDEEELTGYYTLCIALVPFIQRYPLFKWIVKKLLVDRLVDFGEWKFDLKPDMKYATSGVVKKMFLGLCRHIGKGVDTVLGQEA